MVHKFFFFFEGVHKVVVRNHIDRTKKNEGLGYGSSPMCWEILPHQLFQLTFCSLLDDSWDWDAYIFLCSVPASLNWSRVVEGHRSAAVRHDNQGELWLYMHVNNAFFVKWNKNCNCIIVVQHFLDFWLLLPCLYQQDSILIIEVDLQCEKCYKKIQKVLCKLQCA